MASVTMTISDAVPGEVSFHLTSDAPLPNRLALLTPAQRLAVVLFRSYLNEMAAQPPYPKIRVRVNDHPERPPGELL